MTSRKYNVYFYLEIAQSASIFPQCINIFKVIEKSDYLMTSASAKQIRDNLVYTFNFNAINLFATSSVEKTEKIFDIYIRIKSNISQRPFKLTTCGKCWT